MKLYLDEHIDSLDLQAGLAAVGEERRRYALRYRRERDQRLCVSAWLLLQRALRECYGLAQVPPIVRGVRGKPALEGFEHIYFNLSHCRLAAACVVDDHPVGVDVECIDRYDPLLLSRTMSTGEQRLIAAAPLPAEQFVRLWTMKESLLKLTGEDLRNDLASVLNHADNYVFTTSKHAGWLCTVCQAR